MQKPRHPGPGRHPSRRRRNEMALLTPDGPVWLVVPDPLERSRIAKHTNAVRRYIETGDARRLRPFRRRAIELMDGKLLEYATDLATIDRLAEGGELHYEIYRR